MKICDVTQFYSPLSGGVKRYVHEKIAFIQQHSPSDEHVLIVPGSRTEVTTNNQSRIYSISSPLISRATQYRALLNLRALDEIIERERPDIIESADPYQVGWKAAALRRAHNVPAVAFYHSHFAESYLRGPAAALGRRAGELLMSTARAYVRNLYRRFDATLVPSPRLAALLTEWGVRNVRSVDLGVNTEVFRADVNDAAETRSRDSIPPDRIVLLYVGRLANEKNTHTLFEAFARLSRREPNRFHLIIVGDGQQRQQLQALVAQGNVTWLRYCTDSGELARLYRAADLLVHPSIEETFGLVVVESQACGTPVLGIHGSSISRIVLHEQDGWATENTPDALAAAIHKVSPDAWRTFGLDASLRVAERFAWTRVFEQLFCIYRDVCANYTTNHTG